MALAKPRLNQAVVVAGGAMGRTGIGALALAVWCVGALPAWGQFYSLEGRFQCLDDPQAVCFDATSDGPTAPSAAAAPAAGSTLAPAAKARATTAAARQPEAADPLRAIAQRIETGRPASDDAARLRRLVEGGDRRAIELLAWCHLKGLGVARDPVEAFRLYGAAADLGVADARRNQTIVYETVLTSEQRQQVLMAANGVKRTP
jgi:TPR repeat protein